MMFSREAMTASETDAATPPRMASTTNNRFRRGVIVDSLVHGKRAKRAFTGLCMIPARRPKVPGEHGTGKSEARPDVPCIAAHGPKVGTIHGTNRLLKDRKSTRLNSS